MEYNPGFLCFDRVHSFTVGEVSASYISPSKQHIKASITLQTRPFLEPSRSVSISHSSPLCFPRPHHYCCSDGFCASYDGNLSNNILFVREETRPLDLRRGYILLETRERQEQLQLARWSWTSHGWDRDRGSELEFGSVYDGGNYNICNQ